MPKPLSKDEILALVRDEIIYTGEMQSRVAEIGRYEEFGSVMVSDQRLQRIPLEVTPDSMPHDQSPGDEVYVTVPINATIGTTYTEVRWHLRYEPDGNNSGYPWKFLGGSPMVSWENTNHGSLAAATWYMTYGPNMKVPLSGLYHADIKHTCDFPSSIGSIWYGLGVPGSVSPDLYDGFTGNPAAVAVRALQYDSWPLLLTRGQTLQFWYGFGPLNVASVERYLRITPVFVRAD